MKTHHINTYQFSELSPEAQKVAISVFQNDECYLDYPWYTFALEDLIADTLVPEGWTTDVKDIHYSGFASQGDGASFDGDLDILQYINHHDLRDKYPLIRQYQEKYSIEGTIEKNFYASNYCHERTCSFTINWDTYLPPPPPLPTYTALQAEIEALEKDIEAHRLDICQELYRTLEREYDHLLSDESIKEHIKSNNYEFLINGKQY